MRPVLLAAAAAALLASPAHAQLRADAAFPAAELAAAVADTAPTGQAPPATAARPSGRSDRFFARAGLGGLGMVVGALGLGAASYAVFPHCSSCEDPGLTQAMSGVLAGAMLGTAVFAAAPAMGDGCNYDDRFGRALLGSAAGTAVGILGAWATGVALAVPVGTVGGGALATLWCRGREAGAEAR